MNQNLKIIPLGGVEEIGINCTVFEYADQIVVVDMGLGFPDESMYGIDYLVPNIDYLIKRKDQIEGIVITHGHLDHIGALPYLLPKLDFPELIGTQFTLELVKAKLRDNGLLEKAKMRVITADSVLDSGKFRLSFFRVNHSIPQCVGVVIDTPAGRAVHTGDFKFDNSPVNEPVADYARISSIGTQGVDIMLSDSTNSLRKGYPISESAVANRLEDIIERASGRVVVATFSGLVGRLYQLIKIAERFERKVAIAGYGMNQTLQIAQDIGYINPKPGVLVPIQRINRFNDNKVMILSTGSQGESNAALSRMAGEGYKNVHLKKGDTVVISAGTIPGNNTAVQVLIDMITRTGAAVHESADMDFFTSGHGYQEDQKIMLNLLKPKNFMPVHGYQYFLAAHGRTATQVGIPEERIILAERGNVIEGNKHQGFKIVSKVKNMPLLVSGSGVGDVGATVLAERQQLGNHGIVVLTAIIDSKQRKLIAAPSLYTKGFVFVRQSKDILAEITAIAQKQLEQYVRRPDSIAQVSERIQKRVSEFVQTELERDPVVQCLITDVN